MPPKRKRTAAKNKKTASPLKKNKGMKTEETPEHSLSENATQDKSLHGGDSNIDKKTPSGTPQQNTTGETEILIFPEGRLLWLLRHRCLHTREGDNNPTVGLGLAPLLTLMMQMMMSLLSQLVTFQSLNLMHYRKKMKHMEKKLLCEDGIRNSVACLVTSNLDFQQEGCVIQIEWSKALCNNCQPML